MRPPSLLAKCLPMCLAAGVIVLGVDTTSAGIQGSGFRRLATFGVITSTGDVTVNGTAYESARSRVYVNGYVSDKSHLHVGEIVSIEGSIDPSGTLAIADEIAYSADLRGRITSTDTDTLTFVVLDHRVRVTDSTLLAGGSSASLSVGQVVEVSGYPNAAGELVASRVSIEAQAAVAQARGAVAVLDQNAHTFLLGSLLVDYAKANVTGLLAEGVDVVVQGGTANGASMLVASRISVPPPLGGPGDKADLESIITAFSSAADFELNGRRIRADERTVYSLHGGTLGPNVTVRVKGQFAPDGAVVADKVDLVSAPVTAHGKPATAGRGRNP